MAREPLSVISFMLIASTSLLFSSAGCTTAERRAGHSYDRIAEGMSQEEVRNTLGAPDRVDRSADGDVWSYSYGPRPDPSQIAVASAQVMAYTVILGAQVGAVLALFAFSAHGADGNSSIRFWTPDWKFPEVQTASVHFRVVFDRQAKVTRISGIEAGGIGP
jgi:hypothetical protein